MSKEEFLNLVKEHLYLNLYVSKNWDNVSITVSLRDQETHETIIEASDYFDLEYNK